MTTADNYLSSYLDQAANFIKKADALIIAAGAGMGVDSGLPDFRGNEGFWKAYPALAHKNMDFSEIAQPATFHHEPRLAWGFYGHRLNLYRRTVPHEGFGILKKWAETMPKGYGIYTSNVDGQFQKAGFSGNHILECHGSIHWLQCHEKCTQEIWPADDYQPEVNDSECLLVNSPPLCPYCKKIARPNILMFDDWGWISSRKEKQFANLQTWLAKVENPVVIEIGAGYAIPSVRLFSQRVVSGFNGSLVCINPETATLCGGREVGLRMGALAALREIERRL